MGGFLRLALLAARMLGAETQNMRGTQADASAEVTVGSGLAVSAGTSYSPVVAGLDADRAVLCYTDASASMRGVCHLLAASSGGGVQAGSGLALGDGSPAHFPALVRLGPRRALVCYRCSSRSHPGSCHVLAADGGALRSAGEVTVEGPMNQPTLAQLDTDKAVLCRPSVGQTHRGGCHVLMASSTPPALGEGLDVSDTGNMYSPTVAPLSTDRAMLCYLDKDVVRCAILTATGAGLASSGGVSFGAMSMFYITLAPFGTDSAVLCYADISCLVLRAPAAGGTAISRGEVLPMAHGGTSYPAVSRFGARSLVLCHPNDWSMLNGVCSALLVSGARLLEGASAAVTGGSAFQPAIAQVGTNRAVLCYIRDQIHCRLVTTSETV